MEKAIQNIPPMIGSGMVMKMVLSLENIPKKQHHHTRCLDNSSTSHLNLKLYKNFYHTFI